MATLIPSLNSCLPKMMAGEKRFARLLESHLEDDYLCWYETPVGLRQRYTDFIVLHPGRGLLLLEVKDWKADSIHCIDRTSVTLMTGSGLKNCQQPLQQVRQCTYQLINSLEADVALIHPDGKYKGKLVCPYAFGVVLTKITRAQFSQSGWGEVLPAHLVICSDEMAQATDIEQFQSRLWNMFPVVFATPLTLPQIERIRWHLFPEIRISPPEQGGLFADEPDSTELVPDIVRIMDMQQEQLARSMGEGHRVIHGVAGSGKTLILGYRCLQLAQQLNKPILVLCFNVVLAAKLRELMALRGVDQKVSVHHFHDWCGQLLRTYHVPTPKPGPDYVNALVKAVIEASAAGRIPKGQYGAIMIDEGHDFEPEWLQLVVDSVDPESESLLLLYDDAQSIYPANKTLDFTLSSVGVKARGRTTILKLNYRNTEEILLFAYRFAKDYFSGDQKNADNVPLVVPESSGRHGAEPAVRKFDSIEAEAKFTAQCIQSLNQKGMLYSDMCVVYRSAKLGEVVDHHLKQAGIPTQWLRNKKTKQGLKSSDNSVKLMTMHSSKGLEFPFVSVFGANCLPHPKADETVEAKLLYVAMTRATEKLLVTGHADSGYFARLAA